MGRQHEGFGKRLRRRIEKLGPYQSLALLAIPACIVEPSKLAAVAIAGEGHWFTGTAVMVAAYAASLLVLERLFRIVKPKLLTLGWFARLRCWVVAVRDRVMKPFRSSGWHDPAPRLKSRRDF